MLLISHPEHGVSLQQPGHNGLSGIEVLPVLQEEDEGQGGWEWTLLDGQPTVSAGHT